MGSGRGRNTLKESATAVRAKLVFANQNNIQFRRHNTLISMLEYFLKGPIQRVCGSVPPYCHLAQ